MSSTKILLMVPLVPTGIKAGVFIEPFDVYILPNLASFSFLINSKKKFFELIKKCQEARLGKIKTAHGIIDTPAFMPVGTQGTVKGIFVDDILNTKTQIILGNTYHLFLRPGIEILGKFGGLQKFMNWNKPILTDSGGFQVMSLSKLNKIDREKGAIFQSHIDGKKFILSPEKSIQIQKKTKSMVFLTCELKASNKIVATASGVWKILKLPGAGPGG